MHRIFNRYHHDNDQPYKDYLVTLGAQYGVFIDRSVDTGDIPDNLSDQRIREIIRDRYLRDSTVTIILVGTETKHRKHVDWEIHSSMYDGAINKRSGVLVINLPSAGSMDVHAPYGEAEKRLYPDITSWTSIYNRVDYERLYPYMPVRLIDNLLKPEVTISVTPWWRINHYSLSFLIEAAFRNRAGCKYDLSRPMRRVNS